MTSGSFGMNIPWTAFPKPTKKEGGDACEKIHTKDNDCRNHIFNYFSNKSKLVAHTPNVCD